MQDPVEKRLSLGEHLEELRTRVIASLLYVTGGVIVCYCFIKPFMRFVLDPYRVAAHRAHLKDDKLIVLRPAEGFMEYLKVAVIGGLFLSAPLVLREMWKFISAGLYARERRAVFTYLPVSLVLFLIGCAFGYYLLLPAGLAFLLGYPDAERVMMLNDLGSYLNFFFLATLATGLCFQLPLVMMFFSRIGLVPAAAWRRQWRLAVLLSFVVAALLAPSPDPVVQTMLAVPLYILYEGGIVLSRWGAQKRQQSAPEPAP